MSGIFKGKNTLGLAGLFDFIDEYTGGSDGGSGSETASTMFGSGGGGGGYTPPSSSSTTTTKPACFPDISGCNSDSECCSGKCNKSVPVGPGIAGQCQPKVFTPPTVTDKTGTFGMASVTDEDCKKLLGNCAKLDGTGKGCELDKVCQDSNCIAQHGDCYTAKEGQMDPGCSPIPGCPDCKKKCATQGGVDWNYFNSTDGQCKCLGKAATTGGGGGGGGGGTIRPAVPPKKAGLFGIPLWAWAIGAVAVVGGAAYASKKKKGASSSYSSYASLPASSYSSKSKSSKKKGRR